jgi:hypothetical protein
MFGPNCANRRTGISSTLALQARSCGWQQVHELWCSSSRHSRRWGVLAAARRTQHQPQQPRRRKPKRQQHPGPRNLTGVPQPQLLSAEGGVGEHLDAADGDADADDYEVVTGKGARVLPRAPKPAADSDHRAATASQASADELLPRIGAAPGQGGGSGQLGGGSGASPYRVFAPPRSNIAATTTSGGGDSGKWAWDSDGSGGRREQGPPVPAWNPRTGFMRPPTGGSGLQSTDPDLRIGREAAAATAAATMEMEEPRISLLTPIAPAAPAAAADAHVAATSHQGDGGGVAAGRDAVALPAVTREQV